MARRPGSDGPPRDGVLTVPGGGASRSTGRSRPNPRSGGVPEAASGPGLEGPETGGRATAVVVNHDSGPLLAECVESLLGCRAVAGVVVVDNASSDGSVERMRARLSDRSGLRVLADGTNPGYAAAVNRGLERVATDFALLVNPDCVVAGDLVDALIAEADRDRRVAVAGGIVLGTDGALQRATRRRYPSPGRALRRTLRRGFGSLGSGPGEGRGENPGDFDRSGEPLPAGPEDVDAVSGALMLVRTAAVREVGPMDEGYFLHCEDLDWCVRFRRAGWTVRFVPRGFAVHVRGVSVRRRPLAAEWHLHRGMLRFYRKFEAGAHGLLFHAAVAAAVGVRFAVRSVGSLLRRRRRGDGALSSELRAVRILRRRAERLRSPRTLVVGASSPVADALLEEPLEPDGWTLAVSRSGPPVALDEGVVRMRSTDGGGLPGWARKGLRRVVHLAPLWTLPPYLDHLADLPLRRVVACSSTSVVTKADSPDPAERRLARRLTDAEEAVRERCAEQGVELVLLRPTLIYAPGRDRSLERIARIARRWGVVPVAGAARGLRQPVHAADVAGAIRTALERPEAAGRCYDLSGGETLPYRTMVRRIARSVGRRPRVVSVPVPAYRLALRILGLWPGSEPVPPRAADRMNEDLVFDHGEAARDLGFRPRPFLA